MADQIDLDAGAIVQMYESGGESNGGHQPVLQVLSIKLVASGNNAERYRVILSDGIHFIQGMLATQINDLVKNNSIEKHSIVRLSGYVVNIVQNRKIVICLAIDPLSGPVNKIGDPKAIEGSKPDFNADANAGQQQQQGQQAQVRDVKPNIGGANAGGAGGSGLGQRNGSGARPRPGSHPIYPIEGLSPYSNKWTIKARVTTKSEIKHWSNARGEGKLFSCNLLDETGEIRATGFNDAVDSYYNLLQEGKVFYISKAKVVIAKKQFSNLNNEYEIMFERDTDVEPCNDEDAGVPQVKFSFVPLNQLTDVEKDSICDVIGVVKEVGELGSITSKATQKSILKRELTVVDDTCSSVRLTVWGKQAETFSADNAPVIAFKGVKVGDFGGRSLSLVSTSTMIRDPDTEDGHRLRGWFDSQGQSAAFQAYSSAPGGGGTGGSFKLSEFRTITQVKDEQLGMGDTTDYFNLRAFVTFIKQDNLSYPACPTEKCNKKVTPEGDGAWRCEKCDKVYDAPDYRYIMSISVGDHTGQIWLNGFNDIGQVLLGTSANEMERLKTEDDESGVKKVVNGALCKMYDFSCRAKLDNFNDQARTRYSINRVQGVNWSEAGGQLFEQIAAYGVLAGM